MEIRSISALVQGSQGLDALAATAAPPARTTESSEPQTKAAEPVAKAEVGGDPHEARFVRDVDTSAIVFQVVDQMSGDVLAQLPSESALRNRAYAHSTAQSTTSGNVSRVA